MKTAYEIKWSIIVLTSKVTQKQLTQLAKIGYTKKAANAIVAWSGNDDTLTHNQATAITLLRGKKGDAYIITDKQFGLGKITYNGVAQQGVLDNDIVIADGQFVITFPVTQKQLDGKQSF